MADEEELKLSKHFYTNMISDRLTDSFLEKNVKKSDFSCKDNNFTLEDESWTRIFKLFFFCEIIKEKERF